MLDLCLADSRIFYFWHVLESINKFIIELHVLQCLFVRGYNKKQRRGRIFFKFHKRGDFLISYDNQVLLGVISQCAPPTRTLQERPSSPIQFGQEENLPGYSIESRAYWFILKITRMFPVLTSRNRMMNTFIIANINPTWKDSS